MSIDLKKKVSLICALVVLLAFMSACTAVEQAVVETLEARDTTQEAIEELIAEEVETQVGATVSAMETEFSPSMEEVETLVAEGIAATATQARAGTLEALELTAIAFSDEPEATVGQGGGEVLEEATETPTPDRIFIRVTGDSNINIRTGPGTIYDRIGPMAPGDEAPVIAKSQTGWYNIFVSVSSSAPSGWILAEFTEVVGSDTPADIPIVLTIPPTPTPTRTFPTSTPTATPTPSTTPTLTPEPTNTATHTPVPVVVVVRNASTSAICRLVIHPSTKISGENRLGLDPLLPDSQMAVSLTEGATVYDFKAWSCESVLVAQDIGLVIYNGFIWTITD